MKKLTTEDGEPADASKIFQEKRRGTDLRKMLLCIFFVLGSSWFLPVSCTMGVFVGMRLLANIHARDLSQGAEPYADFHVLAVLSREEKMTVLPYSEVKRFRSRHPEAGLLPPNRRGTIERGDERWDYSVGSEDVRGQIIEVHYKGDNRSSTSIYAVRDSAVMPLYSRILGVGHMFRAFLYAFGFSLILFVIGRLLYFLTVGKSRSTAP